jgi:UDP-glucose 4-epimerase
VSLFTITGGAGFIGSHLADALLAAGHSVRAIDDLSTGSRDNLDPRVELIQADIRDRAALLAAMQGASGVFHLAAIASVERTNREWLSSHSVNQGGSIAVYDMARELGGLPVVYASSAAVYGDIGEQIAHESLPTRPLTAYGADKLGSELHGRVAWLIHGVPNVGLRFFNVYGPRQDPSSPYSGVISIFTRLACEGGHPMVFGDGGQTRDFVYVADVVAHLLAAMAHLGGERGAFVFNVCTGRSISVLELARAVLAAAGRDPAGVTHGPARAGDIRLSQGDPSLARAAFGLSALTALTCGLRQTMGLASADTA